ncbi:hypothetical protein FRC11_003355 [Ceratobasidium sp. 423]|nr:hypothetical protein FRC11_003355 [Ceratobasidium sp. 423]
MSSADFRAKSIDALKAGTETRIIICTDTGAFGINIREVERVIIAQHSKTFKTQTQRIGCIREGGTAIIYYQGWMSKAKNSKEAIRLRGEAENVMVEFANASQDFCPRQVACRHWGEPFIQPEICCSLHNPGADDEKHKSELALCVHDAKKVASQNRKMLPGPHKFPPVNKSIVLPAIISLLKEWRLQTWQSIPTRHSHDPAELLLSDELVKHLATRVRACTSIKIFRSIMEHWDHLGSWGDKLYEVIVVIRQTAEEFMAELESQQDLGGEPMEIDEPELETNDGGGEEIQGPAGVSDNMVMLNQAPNVGENENHPKSETDPPQEGIRRSKRLRKSHPDYVT